MIIDKELSNFIKHRIDSLSKSAEENDRLLTNMLLLVTTGAFGLSISFFLGKPQILHCVNMLKISWVFLTLSIIVNAYGYYFSREIDMEHRDFLDEKITSTDVFDGKTYNTLSKNKEALRNYKITRILNRICFYSFIIGIVLLTIFVTLQI